MSKIIVLYSIPCPYTSRIFEVYGPDGMAAWEFRIIENNKAIYDTVDRGYGCATLALRDVLNIGSDWDEGSEADALPELAVVIVPNANNTSPATFDHVSEHTQHRSVLREQILVLKEQLAATRNALAQNETWLRANSALVRGWKLRHRGG